MAKDPASRGAAGRRGKGAGAATGRPRAGLVEMIRHANAPLPAEHSVVFRLATAVAVLTGIIACRAVGEVSVVSTTGRVRGGHSRHGLFLHDP